MINKYVSKQKTAIIKIILLFIALFEISLISISYAMASQDDDILDMLPSILSSERPVKIIKIPLNYPKVTRQMSCVGVLKCDVFVGRAEEFYIPISANYKACAAKISYIGNSRKSYVYVRRAPTEENKLLVGSKVPCAGGGVSLTTLNSVVAKGITVAVVYFSGGTLTGVSGAISEWVAETALSSTIAETFNTLDRRYNEKACGIGDRANWLNAELNVFMIKSNLDCPLPDAGYFSISN